MVERQLPKLNVAGSSPVSRSKIRNPREAQKSTQPLIYKASQGFSLSVTFRHLPLLSTKKGCQKTCHNKLMTWRISLTPHKNRVANGIAVPFFLY